MNNNDSSKSKFSSRYDKFEDGKPIELTHNALSLYKDEVTGMFHLVKIRYNPLTKQIGEYELISCSTERMEMNERFKIEVVNQNILNG